MISVEQRESAAAPTEHAAVLLRHPKKGDGAKVWRLIKDCPPLDQNSLYCNLLQCTHFSDTCVLAERDGEPVGWISAYKPPNDPGTVFVWQVAVGETARGEGLGKSLIEALLTSRAVKGVRRLRTTITESNKPSWALFSAIAKTLGAEMNQEKWLDREREFEGRHDTEYLVTIEPIASA